MADSRNVLAIPGLSDDDARALAQAVFLLENPGFAARLSDLVGTPIEALIDRLPTGAAAKVDGAVEQALRASLKVAMTGLDTKNRRPPRTRLHTLAAAMSGAAGGALGLTTLAVELPVTTTIILRSVADIARSTGEDLDTVGARLACLQVFAFGGRGASDDAAESGYFAVRTALAQAVSEAVRYMARRATAGESAPVIARLLSRIAARFNSVVAEKIVAQGVPVVGALGGAAVNTLFIRHFQDMARGHFTVRRLERAYGEETVHEAYDRIRAQPND